jgi:hypothetical protein
MLLPITGAHLAVVKKKKSSVQPQYRFGLDQPKQLRTTVRFALKGKPNRSPKLFNFILYRSCSILFCTGCATMYCPRKVQVCREGATNNRKVQLGPSVAADSTLWHIRYNIRLFLFSAVNKQLKPFASRRGPHKKQQGFRTQRQC